MNTSNNLDKLTPIDRVKFLRGAMNAVKVSDLPDDTPVQLIVEHGAALGVLWRLRDVQERAPTLEQRGALHALRMALAEEYVLGSGIFMSSESNEPIPEDTLAIRWWIMNSIDWEDTYRGYAFWDSLCYDISPSQHAYTKIYYLPNSLHWSKRIIAELADKPEAWKTPRPWLATPSFLTHEALYAFLGESLSDEYIQCLESIYPNGEK
jgi:hypothetical protein